MIEAFLQEGEDALELGADYFEVDALVDAYTDDGEGCAICVEIRAQVDELQFPGLRCQLLDCLHCEACGCCHRDGTVCRHCLLCATCAATHDDDRDHWSGFQCGHPRWDRLIRQTVWYANHATWDPATGRWRA